jgi:hypothetical protein
MDVLTAEHPLTIRRNEIVFPCDRLLREQGHKIGSQPSLSPVLVMQCTKEIAIEVDRWAKAVMIPTGRCRLYGCFQLTIHQVRIDRDFIGLSAYFISYYDALQFKMSWCEQWAGTF